MNSLTGRAKGVVPTPRQLSERRIGAPDY